ncbi:MAG: hypothetical protein HOP14_08315 [Acidobacteria bacterium]|nr:hypothetical protein [Acidobacteriota bacterium]
MLLTAPRVSVPVSDTVLGRVRSEFHEMPGLRLTVRQAARLFGLSPASSEAALGVLAGAGVLRVSNGVFTVAQPAG